MAFKPFLVPYGGSSPLGASAYAMALEECLAQLSPDWIVLASSYSAAPRRAWWPVPACWDSGQDPRHQCRSARQALRAEVARLASAVCSPCSASRPISIRASILIEDRFATPGYPFWHDVERQRRQVFARSRRYCLGPGVHRARRRRAACSPWQGKAGSARARECCSGTPAGRRHYSRSPKCSRLSDAR